MKPGWTVERKKQNILIKMRGYIGPFTELFSFFQVIRYAQYAVKYCCATKPPSENTGAFPSSYLRTLGPKLNNLV